MKKKNIAVVWLAIIAMMMSLLTGCGSGDPLSKMAKMLNDADGEITLTEIRTKVPAVTGEYSVAEIKDMLIILNDKHNDQLGDVEYYEDICEDLSSSDINTLYDLVTGVESDASSTASKKADKAKETVSEDAEVADEEEEAEDAEDEELRRKNRRSGSNITVIIIIIAVAVVLIAVIVVVIVLVSKNSKKSPKIKKEPISKNVVEDEDDAYPKEDEDEASGSDNYIDEDEDDE